MERVLFHNPCVDLSVESIIETARVRVLEYCGNNKSRAAELLKRSRTFFYRK
ncbi:MAG: helix-turn-helix domain-containing protein [Deltaproteobacteria bacterium]|nr:helix-turn-helix domain-containing protein [Deltaproteobacteria bacterium]